MQLSEKVTNIYDVMHKILFDKETYLKLIMPQVLMYM